MVESGECGAVLEMVRGCLNGASWIEMEFDGFVRLCDGMGSEGDGKGAVRRTLEVGEGCGVPEGKRLSATPVFPHKEPETVYNRCTFSLANLARQA